MRVSCCIAGTPQLFGLSIQHTSSSRPSGDVFGAKGVADACAHACAPGLDWYIKNLKPQADCVCAHANHSPANFYVAPVDPRALEVRVQISFES